MFKFNRHAICTKNLAHLELNKRLLEAQNRAQDKIEFVKWARFNANSAQNLGFRKLIKVDNKGE